MEKDLVRERWFMTPWREVEDNRIGRKELLVARDDEGSGKVCRRM